MPKFFFNARDGRQYPDDEGADLPDLAAARARATRILGELLREQPQHLLDTGRLRVEVTDESGAVLLVLEVFLTQQIAA